MGKYLDQLHAQWDEEDRKKLLKAKGEARKERPWKIAAILGFLGGLGLIFLAFYHPIVVAMIVMFITGGIIGYIATREHYHLP